MRLPGRGLRFTRITHHAAVTQCLASASGGDAPWYLVVAPPEARAPLQVAQLRAFAVAPPAALALRVGTWHAGPLFHGDAQSGGTRDFYNLELSDTNVVDHTSHDFSAPQGCALRVLPPRE
jgi:hypothetical protein